MAVTVSFQDWEELSMLFIERGLNQGIEDIEYGRFQEMNDACTLLRLNHFREMLTLKSSSQDEQKASK